MWSNGSAAVRLAGGEAAIVRAAPILVRSNEGFYHLGIDVVAVELIEFLQPEVVAGVVRVLTAVRVASQVTKVLHQNERSIEFVCCERRVLRNSPQRSCSGSHIVTGCRREAEL